jgi:ATP-binding cassette subfamily F protein 3
MTPGQARGLLARFGISGDLALQTVGHMSGGERTKVALARMHALGPNVMFLDEPTNHLDLWSCAALEKSLREFDGTVLFVSHDRYFIDSVATKVLVFEEDRWRIHEGNYSDCQHFVAATATGDGVRNDESASRLAATRQGSASPPESKPKSSKTKRRFAYRKLEELESDIAHEESLIARLEVDLADPNVHRDADRMLRVQADYEEAQQRLVELLEHWEEAAELN